MHGTLMLVLYLNRKQVESSKSIKNWYDFYWNQGLQCHMMNGLPLFPCTYEDLPIPGQQSYTLHTYFPKPLLPPIFSLFSREQ